jgi:hypothetical protein
MTLLHYPLKNENIFSGYRSIKLPGIFRAPYLLFLLYLIFSAFYIFDSGYPQPADYILALALGGAFIKYCFMPASAHFIGAPYIILFAGYTFVVNIIHYAFSLDISFALNSLYYIYHFLA